MKNAFLIVSFLMVSACAGSGGGSGDAGSDSAGEANAKIVHDGSSCPDLNGTYTRPLSPDIGFSKDENGNLQVHIAGGLRPANGEPMTDGVNKITFSCMQGAVIWEVSGTKNFILRIRTWGTSGLTINQDGSGGNTLYFTKKY